MRSGKSKNIKRTSSFFVNMSVKAQCRVCNNFAQADQFRLHHDYRQMVCPNCFSGKTAKQAEAKKEEPLKPAGWDAEDDYLEKTQRQRKESSFSPFTKIPGSDLLKCACQSCKYVFKYDPSRHQPSSCPYCNGMIPKMRSF